jgi:lysylphosphatidylglycerol synthetase-like protein (DUF2156 family)
MRAQPEKVAALVNGLIVLTLPSLISGAAATARTVGFGVRDTAWSVTVHPAAWTPLLPMVTALRDFGAVMLPFAAVAAWRTWVHARRRRAGRPTDWQGVREAVACGVVTLLILLLLRSVRLVTALMTQPTQTLAYLVFSLLVAAVVGLVLGMLLDAAAILVLKMMTSGGADDGFHPELGAIVKRRG